MFADAKERMSERMQRPTEILTKTVPVFRKSLNARGTLSKHLLAEAKLAS